MPFGALLKLDIYEIAKEAVANISVLEILLNGLVAMAGVWPYADTVPDVLLAISRPWKLGHQGKHEEVG